MPIASAQSMKEAIELFGAGKYSEAQKVLNNIKPQTPKVKGFLCQLYAEEKISPDLERSKQICDEAVAAKDPIAVYVYALANIYGNDALKMRQNEKRGLGFMAVSAIDMDFAPAFDFFCEKYSLDKKFDDAVNFCKVAAARGLRKSMYRMAGFYLDGVGVIQDYEKAKTLYIASAALNYTAAYEILGDSAREGKNGFTKDLRQAYAWYSLSLATKSNSTIQSRRDSLNLSSEDILAAQKMASAWKFKTPRLIDFNMTD
jgi:hypothetical protein